MNAVVDFKLITVDNATDNNTNGSSKILVATILNNFVNGPVQGKLIAAAPEGSTVVPVKNISLIFLNSEDLVSSILTIGT